MNATLTRDEDVIEATAKAVIIYDDFHFAAEAKAMLEHAAHRADGALLWTIKPWRLDLLIQPSTADAAFRDAAEAHLIVLVVRSQMDLSPWLLDWLEKWAGRRQVQDAALALFDGGNGDSLSARAASDLSQFARSHGLSLILGDVDPVKDESAVFARALREREAARTLTLKSILKQPAHGYQNWGINE